MSVPFQGKREAPAGIAPAGVWALLLVAGIAARAPAMQAQEAEAAKVLSARDTLRVVRVGSPTLSPNGEWVLYTRNQRDLGPSIEQDEELEDRTHVWRVRSDGALDRQMTRGTEDASAPQWLPDGGRFAFLSPRQGGAAAKSGGEDDDGPKSQVFFMYLDGGEAWAVTDHEEGIRSYRLSPDGKQIAFLARDPLSEEKKARDKRKDDTVMVDEEYRWTHLWIWDLEKEEARRLTTGDFTVSDPRWSPDSRHVAYVTRPTTKNDDTWNSDVCIVAAGGGEPRKLHDNAGSDSAPRWSPRRQNHRLLLEAADQDQHLVQQAPPGGR